LLEKHLRPQIALQDLSKGIPMAVVVCITNSIPFKNKFGTDFARLDQSVATLGSSDLKVPQRVANLSARKQFSPTSVEMTKGQVWHTSPGINGFGYGFDSLGRDNPDQMLALAAKCGLRTRLVTAVCREGLTLHDERHSERPKQPDQSWQEQLFCNLLPS
jgi:hypothetical protein